MATNGNKKKRTGNRKSRKDPRPRSALVENMLLTKKKQIMRDRRNRRAKDARNTRIDILSY